MKQSELVNRTIFFSFFNLAPHIRRAHVQMFTSMTKKKTVSFFGIFCAKTLHYLNKLLKQIFTLTSKQAN